MMNNCMLLTTILVISVSSHIDEWNMVHFSKEPFEIQECLENSIWWNIIREHVVSVSWREWILNEYSRNLKTRSVKVEYVNSSASQVVDILRDENVINDLQMLHVRLALVGAIMNCTDPEIDFNYPLGHYNPPHFVEDIPEVADLLNFILVDARSFYEATLNLHQLGSYFRKSLSLLLRSLRIVRNSSSLINRLQLMWFRRSALFYDHNSSPQYIRYVFSNDRPRPYTIDNPSFYNSRRFVPFMIRSPPIENNETIFEITSFYAIDWQNYTENYFYSYPPARSFIRSQYFIKNLLSRFFRFLFLCLNLMENGIIDFNNDDNTILLPINLVPENLEQILYNDTAYDEYLSNRQNAEMNSHFATTSHIHISFSKVLGRGRHIAEPDLIMMYFYRIMSMLTRSSTTTTNLVSHNLRNPLIRQYEYQLKFKNTTTTFTAYSTTSKYDDSKDRNGRVTQDLSGKNLPIRQQVFNDGNNIVDIGNPGPSCSNEFKYSKKSISDEYCGYISGPSNEYLPLKKLQDVVSNLVLNEMPIKEVFGCS